MSQSPIDLLPDSIRARSMAGVRAGRVAACAVLALALFLVLVFHSRFLAAHADGRLSAIRTQAEQVMETDRKVTELRRVLKEYDEQIERYESVALPLELTRVLATIIDALPESVTLDAVRLDASTRRPRGPRISAVTLEDRPPDRVLIGEVSGFAATDLEVAELVTRLDGIRPFERVSLDFSRTTTVRNRSAREFRLSFRIDMEAAYEVQPTPTLAAAKGHAHGE